MQTPTLAEKLGVTAHISGLLKAQRLGLDADWTTLLSLLPVNPPPKSSAVPHPTRFVAMTGVTSRGVETVLEWIRPRTVALQHG